MGERIVPVTGQNNCGGRCLLYAHVQDGRVVRMSTPAPSERPGLPSFTACARGLNYHKTFLNEQRLRQPMIRTGERGEGAFAPISWEEALDEIAGRWIRIRDQYGPASRFVCYSTGVSAVLSPEQLVKRLLSLDGGFLDSYNNYSNACIEHASVLMYGTGCTGSSPSTWPDSRMILLSGHNPAESRFDSCTLYYLKKAVENGVPVISVDPRRSDTIDALGARWIPIRPATDSALFDAMALTVWKEGLADKAFLDRCCIGFDEEHLPEGAPEGASVLSWLTGKTDGVEKTPEWAETITDIPAEEIRELAVLYGTAKPAALIQGYGAQRHAYGEQSARGAILLACMTGNVGVPGGWAAGTGYTPSPFRLGMPFVKNPVRERIPVFRWTDAVDHGRSMTTLQGVTGGERLTSDIKMIFSLAGNTLINQHSDINRTAALLRDTDKCEFILASDLFLTPSAKFADILLPGVSMFECENITASWHFGGRIGYSSKAVEPLYESRFEYDWLADLSERLGLYREFTWGRTKEKWLEQILDGARADDPEIPDLGTLKEIGLWEKPEERPYIAFEKEAADPQRYPFPTRSGRIELYSAAAAGMEFEEPFPPIPRYMEPPEGPQDPKREQYPLQLIGWHTKRRCHSIHDNNGEMEKIDPQRVWMHPEDAGERGVEEGDAVLVYNERGKMILPAHITERILKGTAAAAQGAWYSPDENGVCRRGSINVLTSQHPTPLARGNPQHTNLVQIVRAENGER